MASQPGAGQAQAIGQLQQALAYQLTPSTSPVLGPLNALSILSAVNSAAPSRAGSPIHLPPLKLSETGSGDSTGRKGSPEVGTGGGGGGGGQGGEGGYNPQQQAMAIAQHHHQQQQQQQQAQRQHLVNQQQSYRPQSSHPGSPNGAEYPQAGGDRSLPSLSSLGSLFQAQGQNQNQNQNGQQH